MHRDPVDNYNLVRTGDGHDYCFIVLRLTHRPGVRRAEIDFVKEDRSVVFLSLQIDDRQGVGVDPSPLDLGSGNLIPAEYCCDVCPFAVR